MKVGWLWFYRAALPALSHFNPDIVIAINGPLQIKKVRGVSSKSKIVAFVISVLATMIGKLYTQNCRIYL